jgi:hypothetical protein
MFLRLQFLEVKLINVGKVTVTERTPQKTPKTHLILLHAPPGK